MVEFRDVAEFTEVFEEDPGGNGRRSTSKRGGRVHPGDALRRRSVKVTVIAMDPSVRDSKGRILRTELSIPADRVEPGPRSHRFHVVDYDTTARKAHPPAVLSNANGRATSPGWKWTDRFKRASNETLQTDPVFRAQNVWAVAMRTLDNFEQALGRRLPWAFTGHHLYLLPSAFAEPNAYYASEDRAVLFGYVPRQGRPAVHTALAHDVVAHEVTHAILDGLRPRLVEPGLPDQAAFHEGFADIVALLSILSIQEVVEHSLGPADKFGRIRDEHVELAALKDNVVFGVAKQLGATLTGDRSNALRRSVELTPSPAWRNDQTYDEPHRRGEILVAAVAQALLGMWVGRLEALRHGGGLDCKRAAEEGSKAAGHLLGMCIRAIDYTPPVEFEFADYLEAVLVADEVVAPDDPHDYRGALQRAFAAFGIKSPKHEIVDLNRSNARLCYEKLNFDALRVDCDEIYRFIWQNAKLLGVDLNHHLHVERVRHAVRVGPDGLVANEILADYIQMLDVPVGDLAGLGVTVPPGVDMTTPVQVWGGGVLVFDQFGKARFHQRKPLQDWSRQSRRLGYLASHGLADTSRRLGFSYGERRGQRFSALHAPAMRAGESW